MLKFIVVCFLLARASANRRGFGSARSSFTHSAIKPVPLAFGEYAHAEVLSDVRPDGFDYQLESSNGISAKASGDDYGRVHGSFGWISPEGKHVSLSYVADENGYHPHGDLLPTPHPIPEAILKSLQYNEKHAYEEEAEHHDHHHEFDHLHVDYQQHDQHHDYHHHHHDHHHYRQDHHYSYNKR